MRCLPVVLLIPLAFVLTTCSGKQSAPSTKFPKVERLVEQLPAGVEGVELAEDGLRAKKGYRFVKGSDSDTTLTITRMSDRQVVGVLGCGCWLGVGCIPVNRGGIIVCQGFPGCIECGLAVTSGGVRTLVFRYTRKG